MPSALASAKTVGSLQLAGDKHFDSDTLATQEQPPRRWLSPPGGRLCLNPSSQWRFLIEPLAADLPLDIGGYVGTKVVRLPRVLSVRLVQPDGPGATLAAAAPPQELWYPYQIAFQARYAQGASLEGCDFFVDRQSSLVRLLKVQGVPGAKLCLEGGIYGEQARWCEKEQVMVVSHSDYYYALRFVRLTGSKLAAQSPAERPQIQGTNWSLQLPAGTAPASYAVSFGFAAAAEGQSAAVERACKALARPVTVSLAGAKAQMDRFLRQVPQPTRWGLQCAEARGVTAEQQRRAYYMAWAFLVQSTMDPLPENAAYPYPQMSLGKGALWAEGEKSCPATCGWESFLGIQWLAFMDPEFGWQAYEGILSRIDAEGRLGGESLPSRKAQTAWILFQQKPDKARLRAAYPVLKRYLLWREQNPRWIYGNNKAKDEKDLEFVVSWLYDIDYAARIARALGLSDEAALWESKVQPMVQNMRQWFFSDLKELHQIYFAERGVYSTPGRNEIRPIMILTALSVPTLPEDMVARLESLFSRLHNPQADCDGFNYLKYPDNNLAAYGLLERGMPQAQPFIEAVLRDCIRGGEFAEVLDNRDGKGLKADGVKPSLFNALNIIEFTWLLNGARYDSGKVAAGQLPPTRGLRP